LSNSLFNKKRTTPETDIDQSSANALARLKLASSQELEFVFVNFFLLFDISLFSL
jgi:hypothetical protein